MSMEWVRKNYGVPAKRGGRVEYTGDKSGPRFGTITASVGPRLRIKLDGDDVALIYHPTWELRYLDADAIKRCPKCGAGPLGNCGFYGCETPRGTCPLENPSPQPNLVVTDQMVADAREAYRKQTGTEDYQLDGWIDEALRAAIVAALAPEGK